MGFTPKEIRESLSENRYDEVCATYMLLKREPNVSRVRKLTNVYLNVYRIHTYILALGIHFLQDSRSSVNTTSPKQH